MPSLYQPFIDEPSPPSCCSVNEDEDVSFTAAASRTVSTASKRSDVSTVRTSWVLERPVESAKVSSVNAPTSCRLTLLASSPNLKYRLIFLRLGHLQQDVAEIDAIWNRFSTKMDTLEKQLFKQFAH